MTLSRPEGVYADAAPRTNLLPNSGRLDLWTSHNTPVITYPGSAEYFTEIEDDNAGDTEGKMQVLSIPATTENYCFSVYAKAGTLKDILLYLYMTTIYAASFNLLTGVWTVFGGYTPSAMGSEPGPNGTWRVWIAGTNPSGTAAYPYVFPGTGGGSEQGSIEAGAAQFEVGLEPTDYIPTTTAAAQSSGALTDRPEGPRTNLLSYSDQFDNPAWMAQGLLTTGMANVALAPDGMMTADRMKEDTTDSVHMLTEYVTLAAGAVYTASLYAKRGVGARNISLICYAKDASYGFATFNLDSGAITGASGAAYVESEMVADVDGYWRISLTYLSLTGTFDTIVRLFMTNAAGSASYQGDGVSTIFLWRAQAEPGTIATEGIQTGASPVTVGVSNRLGAYADFYGSGFGPTSPVHLVALRMDYCLRVFGTAPCFATGEKCFQTYPTCKYKPAYHNMGKEYEFSSVDVRAVRDGVRPYVVSVKLLPTEIKTSFPVSGRVVVEMADEPDADVGVDPYVTTRAAYPAIPGTFWKKFIARNWNYKGRLIDVYEGQFNPESFQSVKRWTGRLDNIAIGGGKVKIEAVDLLKDLSKIDVPAKIDIKLNVDIDAVTNAFTVTDATPLDVSGAILVGEEIITYAAKDDATGILSGCVRGAYGTTAAGATAKTKVGMVRVYAAMNAFDRMKSMLLDDATIPAENVDAEAFDAARDYFNSDDLTVETIVTEPTKLSVLFFELAELFECKTWVAENLKITIARNIPNDPAREVTSLTDVENIVLSSASSDMNEKSRITRCYLYWAKKPMGKIDDPTSYSRLDVAIDAEAESAFEYGESIPHTIFCRWLTNTGFIEEIIQAFARRLVMRKVWRYRDALPLLNVEVASKDEGMRTGDYLTVSTDEFVDRFGKDISGRQFQVVKRDRKGTKIALSLQQVTPHNIGFIHATGSPNDWESATAEEKKYAYICADDGTLPTDQEGYFIY